MTVDLSVRVIAPIPAGQECVSVGRLLKVGRTLTFAETTFFVGDTDEPAAVALATFVASPRPEDVSVSVVRGAGSLAERAPIPVPAPCRRCSGRVSSPPGVVEVPCHERILNWADTVQGGAVSACAEEAVLAGDGVVPTELEVRFLAAVRTARCGATARRMGPWVRVDVVDVGAGDRLCGVAAARGELTRCPRSPGPAPWRPYPASDHRPPRHAPSPTTTTARSLQRRRDRDRDHAARAGDQGVPHAKQGEAFRRARQRTGRRTSAFILSFVVIGIMWVSHHSMFERIAHVDRRAAVPEPRSC